jgi:hypothetical protein
MVGRGFKLWDNVGIIGHVTNTKVFRVSLKMGNTHVHPSVSMLVRKVMMKHQNWGTHSQTKPDTMINQLLWDVKWDVMSMIWHYHVTSLLNHHFEKNLCYLVYYHVLLKHLTADGSVAFWTLDLKDTVALNRGWDVPSGKHTKSYWSHGPVEIVSFPIQNGDFP